MLQPNGVFEDFGYSHDRDGERDDTKLYSMDKELRKVTMFNIGGLGINLNTTHLGNATSIYRQNPDE